MSLALDFALLAVIIILANYFFDWLDRITGKMCMRVSLWIDEFMQDYAQMLADREKTRWAKQYHDRKDNDDS